MTSEINLVWLFATLAVGLIAFACGRWTARRKPGPNVAYGSNTLGSALARELRPFFALFERYGTPFSLALFHASESAAEVKLNGRQRDLLTALAWRVRENDRVLSEPDGTVAVILPHTQLTDAATLVSRLRVQAEEEVGKRLTVGLVEALDGDFEESIERRSRQALNASRTSPNPVQIQDGLTVYAWQLDRVM